MIFGFVVGISASFFLDISSMVIIVIDAAVDLVFLGSVFVTDAV